MVREAVSMRRDPEGERKGKVIQGSEEAGSEEAINLRIGGDLETADGGRCEKERV
jgi:hypothetical protein